jgi:hypothetical protein
MKHDWIARIKEYWNKPTYIVNGKCAYHGDLMELAELVENKETIFDVNGVSIKACDIIAQKSFFKKSECFFWAFILLLYTFGFLLQPLLIIYGNFTFLLLTPPPVTLPIVWIIWYCKKYRIFGDKLLLRQEYKYSQEMLQKAKENEKVNEKNGNIG